MIEHLLRIYALIFARARFRRLNRLIMMFALRGLGILNYHNSDVSGERYLMTVLRDLILDDSPVIFDIGAHSGQYTRLLLNVFPTARIVALEPHPLSYARLIERGFPEHVKSLHLAAGRAPGQVTLFDRADIPGSAHATLHRSVITQLHFRESREFTVTMDTVDRVASREGLDRIDLLKIDAEGHELEILRGAQHLLSSKRIDIVQFEFNEMNVMSRVFMRDFIEQLEGYSLFRLLPNGLLPIDGAPVEIEIFAFQNILALRNGLAPRGQLK